MQDCAGDSELQTKVKTDFIRQVNAELARNIYFDASEIRGVIAEVLESA